MLNAVIAAASQWLRYRQTLHEFRKLDPRMLSDIGISRNNLPAIAAMAAQRPGNIFALSRAVSAMDKSNAVPVTQQAQSPYVGRAVSLQDCRA